MHGNWKLLVRLPDKKQKNWLENLLLKNRKIETKAQKEAFLHPKIEDIFKVNLTQVPLAISRIEEAIKNKEKIIVYSDYDADGICATAIVWETLYDLGANILPYVPHRVKEGYGLSNEAIKKLAGEGNTLIITVDHGVTAKDQVEYAKTLGVDIVITDHHVLPKNPPKSKALVHTTSLCGAGVAWLLCWHFVKKVKPKYQDILLEKLELAALATIADLVPLVGANRSIVKFGLQKVGRTKRPGLRALIKESGIQGSVGTYEIGHMLGPRLNAMGRIEHAIDALRLLCAKTQESADRLAKLLSETNIRRQSLTTQALDRAKSLVDEEKLVGVVAHKSLHEGVIGLVASRLVESFNRPMIVISKGQNYSKGSARSVAGFNIVEAIRHSSEFLVDGGGHPMAAGFTIKTEYIEAFTTRINSYAIGKLTDKILNPTLVAECELLPAEISRENFEIIKKLEPFGMGNPTPLFLGKKMLVEDIRTVGSDKKHLRLQLSGIGAIGFNLGPHSSNIRPGYLLDVMFNLDENRYNGHSQLQLKIKDLNLES